jgi:replicative DNA helicase
MQKKFSQEPSNRINAEKVLGKSLPFSMEAERAVLGALLLNDSRIDEVAEILKSDDFYVTAHRLIFGAMVELSRRRQRVDLITLQDVLEKSDSIVASGGMAYLIALQEDIPALGLLEQHARLIKEKSTFRELIDSATTIIANCYAQDERGIEAVVDDAEKIIFNIAAKRSSQSFVQLNIWLKKTFQSLSEIKGHAKGITGVPSGFAKLDEMTSGFQKSDFVVLAARPSMGKTALALSYANYAARCGLVTGFFSLEMSAEQLTVRLLSGESAVAHHNIRNATITSDEWIELTNAAARLAERKFFIDDTASQTIMDVRAKARRLKQEHGLQFLIIDYLQLINSHKHHENRHQEVSEISRSLKALAKELSIPIVALSQLSRAVDGRVDKRPLLSDLRESGAIEQDADLIMFLYRDCVYNPDTEHPSLAELIIGKQRNGPTGTVYLTYQRELTLFEDSEQ